MYQQYYQYEVYPDQSGSHPHAPQQPYGQPAAYQQQYFMYDNYNPHFAPSFNPYQGQPQNYERYNHSMTGESIRGRGHRNQGRNKSNYTQLRNNEVHYDAAEAFPPGNNDFDSYNNVESNYTAVAGSHQPEQTSNHYGQFKQRGRGRNRRQQQGVEYYNRQSQDGRAASARSGGEHEVEANQDNKNYSDVFPSNDAPQRRGRNSTAGPRGRGKKSQYHSSYGSYYDGPHIQQSKNWQRQQRAFGDYQQGVDNGDDYRAEDQDIGEYPSSKQTSKGNKGVNHLKFKEKLPKEKEHDKRKSKPFGNGRYPVNRKYAKEDDETQRGSLIEQLSNNTYECMVCCDIVRCEASIWSCSNCYHVFHLHCIKKWAKSPNASVEGQTSGGWRCPACQNVSAKFPSQYRCFCGKVRDPDFNRHDTPHSCGEVCRKKRPADCTHPCNILCHPGPCPQCQATVTKQCDCKKTKQTVKCGQSANLKCSEPCNKTLNCGKHVCKQVCHPGSCDPCDETVEQECFCNKEKRVVTCGSSESFARQFKCEQLCDRLLECGQHRCEQVCHPGVCDKCSLLPSVVTHCHCGQTPLQDLENGNPRTACTDPIPVCGKICNKELPCGPPDDHHLCQMECHGGPCGPCSGFTDVTCRCGAYNKEFSCVETTEFTAENPFTCDKRCNKKKTCGRHKCGQTCCVGTEHICQATCGQKLTCGQHRCEEPCHRGNCPQCWQVSFDELRCICGAEVLYPPIACGIRPPECHKTCTRQHGCDHPVRHNCHSEDVCPVCPELTERWCMGKHELRKNIPCHVVDISCGMPCNSALPCGHHMCLLPCHKSECLTEDQDCQQPCLKPRDDCGHSCNASCHGDSRCPKSVCQTEIYLKCKCGNRTEKSICQAGAEELQDYQRMAMSMMAMRMNDDQSIDISNLTSEKKKSKELECNSDCALKERNRRLALALEIKNPDMRAKLQQPPYSDFLKYSAKQYPIFVAGVEKALSELVQKVEEGKLSKRSQSFPSMPQVQRKVIHELAEFYGCETQSYDLEPNKNVVATANRGKCWHPKMSLTHLIQREMHPKAPPPIPLGSREQDIRSSMQAVRQGTNVMGATGWSTARVPTQRPLQAAVSGATGSWASLVKTKPQQSQPQAETAAAPASKPSFVSLSKLKQDKEEPQKVIDYFDME